MACLRLGSRRILVRPVSLAVCVVLAFAVSVEGASGARDASAPAAATAKKKCKRGSTRNKRGRCVKKATKSKSSSQSDTVETSRPFAGTSAGTNATALFTQLLSGAKLSRVVASTRQLPIPTPELPTLPTTGLPIPTPGLPTLPTTGLPIPTPGSAGQAPGSAGQAPGSPIPTPGSPIPTLSDEGYFFCAGGKLAYDAESVGGSGASIIAWQGTWKVVGVVTQGDLVSGIVNYTTNSTATPPGPSGVIVIDLYRSTQQAFIGVAPGVGLEYQRQPGLGVGC